jgi:uncharacterized protein YceK
MMNQSPPGTFFNSGAHRPNRLYGGVRRDGELLVNHVAQVARGEPTGSHSSVSEHDPVTGESVWRDTTPVSQKVRNAVGIPLLFLVDIPLSFVGDTIFLPVDIIAQWKRLTGRTPVEEKFKPDEPPPLEGVQPLAN